MKIKCSKCGETAVVAQPTDVMPTHWRGEELCDGAGCMGKVVEVNTEPAVSDKNSNIIFTQPLEG